MKWRSFLLFLLILGLGGLYLYWQDSVSLFPTTITPRSDSLEEVTLDYCLDGDTAIFLRNGQKERVRFYGVNAPEVEGEGTEAEPYGQEAAQKACSLMRNAKHIYLEFEGHPVYDQYGRLLAWVWNDEKLLQEQLVSEGYVTLEYLSDSNYYSYALKRVERQAKEEKKGIWGLE